MATVTQIPHLGFEVPYKALAALCQKHGVRELAVFGSVLRDDFRPDSDIDLLVSLKNDDYGPWMRKLTALQDDLSRLLRRRIDLVPKHSLKWVIRDRVLAEAQTLYED